jgi:hypothetical protein
MELAKECPGWHHFFMSLSTVAEIKTAINRLSLEERAEIIAELCGWADDDWDRQMKDDAAAGKFTALNREAEASHAAGQTFILNDILLEP